MLESVSIFQYIHQRQKHLPSYFLSFIKQKIKEISETISLAKKFDTTSDLALNPNRTKRCERH